MEIMEDLERKEIREVAWYVQRNLGKIKKNLLKMDNVFIVFAQ